MKKAPGAFSLNLIHPTLPLLQVDKIPDLFPVGNSDGPVLERAVVEQILSLQVHFPLEDVLTLGGKHAHLADHDLRDALAFDAAALAANGLLSDILVQFGNGIGVDHLLGLELLGVSDKQFAFLGTLRRVNFAVEVVELVFVHVRGVDVLDRLLLEIKILLALLKPKSMFTCLRWLGEFEAVGVVGHDLVYFFEIYLLEVGTLHFFLRFLLFMIFFI